MPAARFKKHVDVFEEGCFGLAAGGRQLSTLRDGQSTMAARYRTLSRIGTIGTKVMARQSTSSSADMGRLDAAGAPDWSESA